MNVQEHELGDQEEVHEEKREIPPKDPSEKKFEDLLAMMKTIVDQMQLQNEHAGKREAQERAIGPRGSPRTPHA